MRLGKLAAVAVLAGLLGASGCGSNVEGLFGPGEGGSGGQGGSGGGGAACVSAADCPAAVCVDAACVAGSCVGAPTPVGTPAPGEVPGDCQQVVCDGNGAAVLVPDDADLPDDGLECTVGACDNGVPTWAPAPAGTPCDDAGGSFCDSAGQCVVTGCGDGVIGMGEGCDDGNTADGDGCDSNCTVTACGNGIVTAGEACDDGNADNTDACLSSCQAAACGDGAVQTGVEVCDDGNLDDTDCCSSACVLSGACPAEQEPNNACPPMAAPLTPSPEAVVLGSIQPVGDEDWFAFTVTGLSAVQIETFSGSVPGACEGGVDTIIELYADDCITQLGIDDDDGLNYCSLIEPVSSPLAGALAAGTYYVRVTDYADDTVIPAYALAITLLSTCGNGQLEGAEQCDDDNAAAGDGCSASCQVEPGYICDNDPMPSACSPAESACSDGADNDGDGATDLADPDCALAVDVGPCGPGEALYVFQSSAVPADILDNATASSPLAATAAGTIARAAVQVSIDHSYDSDLDISLLPPGGMPLDLSSDNGGAGDDYQGTIFDSACPAPVAMGMAPFAGCYSPEQPLTTLSGAPAAGTWTLRVADDANADQGQLLSWSLALCVGP